MTSHQSPLARLAYLVGVLFVGNILGACSQQDDGSGTEPEAAPQKSTTAALNNVQRLAANLQFCTTPDPANPSSAFIIEESEHRKDGDHWMDDYWVHFQCQQPCDDWQQCAIPAYENDGGALIRHGRDAGTPKRALAFVVDGMGGHMAFTTDGGPGDKTMFVHQGGGATTFYHDVADKLERSADVQTVMVRWEQKGFRVPSFFPGEAGMVEVGWGWFTRTSEAPATVPQQNKRVASAIAWVHDNLAGADSFGTMACSMGTNATLGPVLWYGLDDIIDYQLFSGGPFFWDVNSACARRTYEQGFCDIDGTTQCSSDADCASVSDTAVCRVADTIWEADYELYESVVNHTHATSACRIADAKAQGAKPYPPFDDSSYVFMDDADWAIDHPVDIVADIGGVYTSNGVEVPQGDETLLLGHFLPVFNRIESDQKYWHAYENSLHCEKFETGELNEFVIERMGLQRL